MLSPMRNFQQLSRYRFILYNCHFHLKQWLSYKHIIAECSIYKSFEDLICATSSEKESCLLNITFSISFSWGGILVDPKRHPWMGENCKWSCTNNSRKRKWWELWHKKSKQRIKDIPSSVCRRSKSQHWGHALFSGWWRNLILWCNRDEWFSRTQVYFR